MNREERLRHFAAWLKQRMDERGIDQAELARLTSLTDEAIRKWLYGKSLPEIEACVGLHEALGVNVTQILVEAGRITPELAERLLRQITYQEALHSRFGPHLAEELIAVIHTIICFHHADPQSARIASPAPDPQPTAPPTADSQDLPVLWNEPEGKNAGHQARVLRKLQEDAEQEGGDGAESEGGNGDP